MHRGRMMDKYEYLRHTSARRSLFPEIWNCLSPRMIGRILTILFTCVYAQRAVKKSARSVRKRTVTRNQRNKTDELKRHWGTAHPVLIPLCTYYCSTTAKLALHFVSSLLFLDECNRID